MSDDEKRMTFTEHLGELRTRIIHSGIAIVVAVVLCYLFSNAIFNQISRPLAPLEDRGFIETEESDGTGETSGSEEPHKQPRTAVWGVYNPLEYVIVKFKIAGYGGALLASPFVLWQLCAFIFPGLRPKERRAVRILIFGSASLAIIGIAVAYFGVFPLVLPYLLQWVPEGVEVNLRMNETLSIIIMGLAGFAIAFQFPMAVLILVYMGLLSPATLKKYRKIAIVGMAVASAMLTPTDPVYMVIMLFPLALMYESSIWLSYLVIRRKKMAAQQP